MVILTLAQDERDIDLAIFNNMLDARSFAKKIPGYELEKDGEYIFESLDYKAIPDYIEIEFKGHIVPLTRFMFESEDDKIDIFYRDLENLSIEGKGMVDGATRVDAYSVNNLDLKNYISKREEKYLEVKKALNEKGIEVSRSFYGSEDGEAILYKKAEDQDWTFLCHMDPFFTSWDTKEIVENL